MNNYMRGDKIYKFYIDNNKNTYDIKFLIVRSLTAAAAAAANLGASKYHLWADDPMAVKSWINVGTERFEHSSDCWTY